MGPKVLFNDQHIYDFVESQTAKLKKAYEGLPDDKATDELFTQEWKRQFMLDVPSLKPDKWEAEERQTETVVYVPFEGDPSVFKLSPSAFNGTVAVGEIVDHDLLITVSSYFPNFDVAAHVKRELGNVEWRLNNLRGSTEHLNQQLEIGLRESMAARKRVIENKARAPRALNIPRRAPALALGTKTEPLVVSKPAVREKLSKKSWDIFMSYASPDQPYVRQLVAELRKADISVWFDDDSVDWGEPLRQAIKNGLKNSTYGIVVLSKAYLADRKWTEHEFDGLFAREKLNSFIILPVWHGVTRAEIEAYDPALADRKGSISDSDDYGEIVGNVLKLLGHKVTETASSPYISNKYKSDELELIAYVWYYTKDGKGAQMYVRKVIDKADLFRLEEQGGTVHEGTRKEIADKYSSIDRRLLRDGLTHHVRNSSSAYPDFK